MASRLGDLVTAAKRGARIATIAKKKATRFVKKVSPAAAVTGASAGYFTGGLEATRKSQMDAYNQGLTDASMKKVAALVTQARVKAIAKNLGVGAAGFGTAHVANTAFERKLNNIIGEAGGIKAKRQSLETSK